jgi:hypothetical protein
MSKLLVDVTALAAAKLFHVSCSTWTTPSTEAMAVDGPEVMQIDPEDVVVWL